MNLSKSRGRGSQYTKKEDDEDEANFLRMPMKMRNLELSLWFSSAGCTVGGGVEVEDMVAEDEAWGSGARVESGKYGAFWMLSWKEEQRRWQED